MHGACAHTRIVTPAWKNSKTALAIFYYYSTKVMYIHLVGNVQEMTNVIEIKFEYALFINLRGHILIIIAYSHNNFPPAYLGRSHGQISLPWLKPIVHTLTPNSIIQLF